MTIAVGVVDEDWGIDYFLLSRWVDTVWAAMANFRVLLTRTRQENSSPAGRFGNSLVRSLNSRGGLCTPHPARRHRALIPGFGRGRGDQIRAHSSASFGLS